MNRNTKFLFFHKFLYEVYFYGAIFVPFFVTKDYSIASALAFASVYMLTLTLTEVPTGIVGDRYGHRVSIIAGALLTAIAMFGFLYFTNTVLDIAMIIVLGIGGSLVSGSDVALLKSISHKFTRDNRLYSYLKSSMLLISFALAGFFVSAFGMSITIGLTGVLALLCILPLLFVRTSRAESTYFPSLIEQTKAFPIAIRTIKGGASLIILGGLAGAITFSAKETISSFHNIYGISLELVGILAASAMAGRIAGTFLEEHLHIKYKWLFGALVIIFALTVLIDIDIVAGIALVLIGTIVAQMTYYRLKYRLSIDAPKKHVATTLSALSLTATLISAGIIYVTGVFAGLEMFHISFIALGGAFAIAAALLLPNLSAK